MSRACLLQLFVDVSGKATHSFPNRTAEWLFMKHFDPSADGYPSLDERRLSPVAAKAVSRVFKAWNCSDDEAASLIGLDRGHWRDIADGNFDKEFTQEQLLRASHLIGIYRGLQVFSEDVAKQWPKLPNTGPLFEGRTPIKFMVEGGFDAIEKIRQYADGLGY